MEDRALLITINRQGKFSLEEARAILPVVRKITNDYSAKVETLIARLETTQLTQTDTICTLEKQVNELIQIWNDKIRKLGAEPRGLWVVDFDSGHGYFCWKQPEHDILYWHTYNDGYSGRQALVTHN